MWQGVDKNQYSASHNHFLQKPTERKCPQHPKGLRRYVIIFVTTINMDCVTGQDPMETLGVSPSRILDHRMI